MFSSLRVYVYLSEASARLTFSHEIPCASNLSSYPLNSRSLYLIRTHHLFIKALNEHPFMCLSANRRDRVRAARAMSIVELERMPEFEILNSLVTQQDISCANAVQRIVEITLSFTGNNSFRGGGHLYDTACCTLELAQRTETREGRSKLVDFELELQKQDILNPASGMRMDNDGDLIWQDLPTFGYTFVDELGSFSSYTVFPHIHLIGRSSFQPTTLEAQPRGVTRLYSSSVLVFHLHQRTPRNAWSSVPQSLPGPSCRKGRT